MTSSSKISKQQQVQGSLTTSTGFKSWRDPLTSWWTHEMSKLSPRWKLFVTQVSMLQREQGRVHPLWIFACNGILQGWKEISRTASCLETGCRHRLLTNQYKNSCMFVSFFPTLLISVVHFYSRFYCWLSFFSVLHLLNNIVKSLEE